jgi:serine/threonine protein kinase
MTDGTSWSAMTKAGAGADQGSARPPLHGNGTQTGSGSTGYQRTHLPPRLADRYSFVRELHQGNQADVLLVAEKKTRVQRVLKLYKSAFVPDEEALKQLEGATQAHVVQFVDLKYGQEESGWFEVLEFCEGGSLRELLQGDGVPPVGPGAGGHPETLHRSPGSQTREHIRALLNTSEPRDR